MAAISKEAKSALIDALKRRAAERKSDYYTDGYFKAGIEQAIEIIESFPTIQPTIPLTFTVEQVTVGDKIFVPENSWIPCSERLPEEGIFVLCYTGYEVVCSKRIFKNECVMFSTQREYETDGTEYSITHWQPLHLPPTE